MVRVAIIEDSEEDFAYLASLIQKFQAENGEEIFIKHYTSGLLFLDEYKSDADIIFMDIELPDIDGVLASERLRLKDENVALIFVTNLAHMAIKGYSVAAVDFIVKPVNYYKLSALLIKLIKKVKMSAGKSIMVSTSSSIAKINIYDIEFAEVEAHRITIHYKDKEITYSGTLTAFERLLPSELFIRCHQSFIVNIKYIVSCNGTEITLANGMAIPLSRNKKKQIMQKLSAYFSHGGE